MESHHNTHAQNVQSENDNSKESTPARPQERKNKKKPRVASLPFAASKDGGLEHISKMEADPALEKFPDFLRQQLKKYLAKPNATPGVFGTRSTTFSIYRAGDTGKPMYFYEPDSDIRLDAAQYRYGIGKKGVQVVVVKARAGSTFNNGDPAIIMYYGKKSAGGGRARENGSRWAIWTPDGLRKDLIVDRVRVEEEEEAGADANDNDSAPDADNTGANTPIKLEDSADHDSTVDNNLAAHNNTPADDIYIVGSTHIVGNHRPALKRVRSQSGDQASRNVRRRSSVLSASRSSMSGASVPTAANSNLRYVFRETLEDPDLVAKSNFQCNSVHKLFAYAQSAGICSSDEYILSLHIDGNKIMDIVRDDGEDFALQRQCVSEQRQLVGEDATIVVVITPFHE